MLPDFEQKLQELLELTSIPERYAYDMRMSRVIAGEEDDDGDNFFDPMHSSIPNVKRMSMQMIGPDAFYTPEVDDTSELFHSVCSQANQLSLLEGGSAGYDRVAQEKKCKELMEEARNFK